MLSFNSIVQGSLQKSLQLMLSLILIKYGLAQIEHNMQHLQNYKKN
jgi:hypothetical protein